MNYIVLYVAVVGIFLSVLCMFVYWALLINRWDNFAKAVSYAIDNEIYCPTNTGPCELKSNDHLSVPTEFTRQFSYPLARYCADLVARIQLLFRENTTVTELLMPPNVTNIKTLYFNNKIIGFVAKLENTYFIAYRGTSTAKEWVKDFEFMQYDIVFNKRHRQAFSRDVNLSCHKGFLDVYEQCKRDIHAALEGIDIETNVVVTGHSLGSALATLTCLDLRQKCKVTGYCFGTPRVCKLLPTEDMHAFFRINNTCDPVKEMPLSVMWNIGDYKTPVFYQHGGQEYIFTSQRESLTNNHLMPLYIDALDNRRLRV